MAIEWTEFLDSETTNHKFSGKLFVTQINAFADDVKHLHHRIKFHLAHGSSVFTVNSYIKSHRDAETMLFWQCN